MGKKVVINNARVLKDVETGETFIQCGCGDNLVPMGGGSAPTPAPGGASDCDWNIMKNKPFYDESKEIGSTITWDGNTEGLPEVVMMSDGPAKAGFYLVASDVAIVGDIDGDITITEEIVSSNGNDAHTDTLSKVGNVIVDGSGNLVIALEDNATLSVDEDATFTFAKKGVWFVRADIPGNSQYTSSVTLHDGSFIEGGLKKLDPKFIPDTISGVLVVTKEFNSNVLSHSYQEILDALTTRFVVLVSYDNADYPYMQYFSHSDFGDLVFTTYRPYVYDHIADYSTINVWTTVITSENEVYSSSGIINGGTPPNPA